MHEYAGFIPWLSNAKSWKVKDHKLTHCKLWGPLQAVFLRHFDSVRIYIINLPWWVFASSEKVSGWLHLCVEFPTVNNESIYRHCPLLKARDFASVVEEDSNKNNKKCQAQPRFWWEWKQIGRKGIFTTVRSKVNIWYPNTSQLWRSYMIHTV